MLGAVVQELARKARKALDGLPGADASGLRMFIVEVEQAADSAKDEAHGLRRTVRPHPVEDVTVRLRSCHKYEQAPLAM